MGWHNKGNKVLIPPFNFGRKTSDEDWDKWFPNAPKRPNESDEEYEKRVSDKGS